MVVVSRADGEVSYVDATKIQVRTKASEAGLLPLLLCRKSYQIPALEQDTCLNQRPLVAQCGHCGGQVLAMAPQRVGNWL